jgi:hypothetical protein
MEQNYFQCDHQNHKQTDGLVMGAPTAAILADMYLCGALTNIPSPNKPTSNWLLLICCQYSYNL